MNLVRVDYLRGNIKNPRKIKDHRFAELVNSLLDLPEMLLLRPVVYDEEGTVLGGNMRLKAVLFLKGYSEEEALGNIEHKVFHRGLVLDEMGNVVEEATEEQKAAYRAQLHELFFGDTIPGVEALGLTPAQKKEFIAKDNASFGEWDWDALLAEGYGKELAGWGIETPDGWGETGAGDDFGDLDGELEEEEIKEPLKTQKCCPNCGFEF
jgi:hypothetical protein